MKVTSTEVETKEDDEKRKLLHRGTTEMDEEEGDTTGKTRYEDSPL